MFIASVKPPRAILLPVFKTGMIKNAEKGISKVGKGLTTAEIKFVIKMFVYYRRNKSEMIFFYRTPRRGDCKVNFKTEDVRKNFGGYERPNLHFEWQKTIIIARACLASAPATFGVYIFRHVFGNPTLLSLSHMFI